MRKMIDEKRIATIESDISINTSGIGVLANLTTTAKTNLVAAVNEVNAKITDSGWLTPTLVNGATGTLQYRKINGVVYFRGKVTTTGSGEANYFIEMPSGYRRDQLYFFGGYDGSGLRKLATYHSSHKMSTTTASTDFNVDWCYIGE